MKTRKKNFNLGKQPENKVFQEIFSQESNEGDQSSAKDENSFRNKGVKTYNESNTNNPPKNLEKIRKTPKYSFVVDWQIPK